MHHPKFSRRAFIQSLLTSLILAGCGSDDSDQAGIPTASVIDLQGQPLPTNTPIPASPDVVAQQFLNAWAQGNYDLMYDLASADSRNRTPYHTFFAQYQNARTQTTATEVRTQVQSLLVDGSQATATYNSQWVTALFDTIDASHLMRLIFENDQWRIAWEPALILPQLGTGVSLVLSDERPKRGIIFDAADQAIASHKQLVTIGVVPGQVTDEAQLISQLTTITNLTADDIREKMISAQPDWFVPLASIDFDASVQHHDTLLALPGVQRQARPVRAYPIGDIAAHILGTMGGISAGQLPSYRAQGYHGDEIVGLTGVERWGESFLAGKRGGQLVTMNSSRKVLAEIATAPPRPGGNVYLNLDTNLQRQAEIILGPRKGSIVLMEPNGIIRAMVSYPRYFPEDFANGIDTETWSGLINNPDLPLINRATQGLYPPASVFKIISMAAAMEHLGYQEGTSFFCSGYWNELGDDFVKACWLKTGHGQLDLADGLIQSCDVVFYDIGLALHREETAWLPNMARAFGLGESLGVMGIEDLGGVVPDETWKQRVKNAPFYDGDAVNMAIGQGDVLVTPLQVARMYAAIANGGIVYRPQLVRRITSRDSGDQIFEPEIVNTLPISPGTLAAIQNNLYWVVQGQYGTARRAFQDASYTVAGKTGTAETHIDEPHAWFAGYTPADNPEIVIVVVLEHAGEGSEEAAPLFKAMADAYFGLADPTTGA